MRSTRRPGPHVARTVHVSSERFEQSGIRKPLAYPRKGRRRSSDLNDERPGVDLTNPPRH